LQGRPQGSPLRVGKNRAYVFIFKIFCFKNKIRVYSAKVKRFNVLAVGYSLLAVRCCRVAEVSQKTDSRLRQETANSQ